MIGGNRKFIGQRGSGPLPGSVEILVVWSSGPHDLTISFNDYIVPLLDHNAINTILDTIKDAAYRLRPDLKT